MKKKREVTDQIEKEGYSSNNGVKKERSKTKENPITKGW